MSIHYGPNSMVRPTYPLFSLNSFYAVMDVCRRSYDNSGRSRLGGAVKFNKQPIM